MLSSHSHLSHTSFTPCSQLESELSVCLTEVLSAVLDGALAVALADVLADALADGLPHLLAAVAVWAGVAVVAVLLTVVDAAYLPTRVEKKERLPSVGGGMSFTAKTTSRSSSPYTSTPYPALAAYTKMAEHKTVQDAEYSILSPSKKDDDPGIDKQGLWQFKAMLSLCLWYFFSTCTLFLNKHILVSMKGEATLLSCVQMIVTALLGFVQMHVTCGMYKTVRRDKKPANFYKNMTVVGSCRFVTVFLGLMALKYIAVSFTETVKSSAPIFTVLIAFVLLGETTGLRTQLSLIPIMGGLALCSAYELSFSLFGFFAALSTNITECIQNVYSKLLISGEKYKYSPGEMQFYTAVASVVIIIPFSMLIMDIDYAWKTTDSTMMFAFLLNGFFFHCQTMAAYVLMGYISPVTHSVCNTVKRALMIWLSVLWFGNKVTFLSGMGTIVVTVGVFLYNQARQYDDARKAPLYSDRPAINGVHKDVEVVRDL